MSDVDRQQSKDQVSGRHRDINTKRILPFHIMKHGIPLTRLWARDLPRERSVVITIFYSETGALSTLRVLASRFKYRNIDVAPFFEGER
jgi:hypothetical protein